MNLIQQAHLPVAARTHPGMGGKTNEDRFAISAHQVSSTDPRRSLLAVVADGIGGHRAGEVAAEIAVEEISSSIAASDASQPVEILTAAIIQASQKIQQQSKLHSEQTGMGSTCVCAWVIEDRLYTASVGDSRLYLLRNNKIQQLTVDHTWIQEAMDLGLLTSSEAVDHPNQHVIRRYLGSPKTVDPDVRMQLDVDQSEIEARREPGPDLGTWRQVDFVHRWVIRPGGRPGNPGYYEQTQPGKRAGCVDPQGE